MKESKPGEGRAGRKGEKEGNEIPVNVPLPDIKAEKKETKAELNVIIANLQAALEENRIGWEQDNHLIANLRKELAQIEKEEEEREEREKPEKERKEKLEIDKQKNPFKYFLIGNMSEDAFWNIYLKKKEEVTLEDINNYLAEDGKEMKTFTFQFILPNRHNTVRFSSNGFTLQLINKDEVKGKDGIRTWDPNAKYILINPNGEQLNQIALNHEDGERLLIQKADEYQAQQIALFESQA